MAFETNNGKLTGVGGGEVWATAPYAATNYASFADGLEIGRFAQIKAGVLSNLDATSTPDLAGVVIRNTTGALEDGTQVLTANSANADVADFGRVTVYVASGVTPSKGDAVYAVTSGADAGKATTDNAALAIPDAVFYKEVKTGVWVVTLKQYMK